MSEYRVEYRKKGNLYGRAIDMKIFTAQSFHEAFFGAMDYNPSTLTWKSMTRVDTGEIITLEQVRSGEVESLPRDR